MSGFYDIQCLLHGRRCLVCGDKADEEVAALKKQLEDMMAQRDNWFKRRAGMAERAIDQKCRRMENALTQILDQTWTAVTDGSEPEDCTPNEKGLLGYVGRVLTIAKDALAGNSLITTCGLGAMGLGRCEQFPNCDHMPSEVKP